MEGEGEQGNSSSSSSSSSGSLVRQLVGLVGVEAHMHIHFPSLGQ